MTRRPHDPQPCRERRSHISADLERQVLIEAGHRCAIPTCKQIPAEIHHIVPFAEIRGHEFHNLIALCPTCHARCLEAGQPRRGEIDRKAMFQYKANVGLLNARYGEYERRVLALFGKEPPNFDSHIDGPYFLLPEGREIDLYYLLSDGMIQPDASNGIWQGQDQYKFTERGRSLIQRIREGQVIQ